MEGMLFKKVNSTQYVIMWPRNLNKILIQTFHVYSGQIHLKKKKLKQLLDTHFDIQEYNTEIQNIIESCEFCLRNNPSPQKKVKLGGPTFLIKGPFQYFSFDYVTICSSWKKYGDVLSGGV